MPRVTCLYKLTGTETFRLASSKLFGYGTNMQNWSKELRKLVIADDGKVFVQVDQAGAEALVVAYLCTYGNFRELFLSGVKSHVFVALRVFEQTWRSKLQTQALSGEIDFTGIFAATPGKVRDCRGWKIVDTLIKDSDNWQPSERYYYIAKMICHAANYGMKAPAFQLNVLQKSEGKIALSKQEAEDYLETYHGLFPEIREWHRWTEDRLQATRVLRNLQGYPRVFVTAWNDTILKEALAFTPQSTVGTITNVAYTQLQAHIETHKLQWDLLNNCHDSYLVQVPIAEAQEAAKVMTAFMEQDLVSPRGEKFKMKAAASVGHNWGSYGKKNLEGMKEI